MRVVEPGCTYSEYSLNWSTRACDLSRDRNASRYVSRFPVDFATLYYRNIREIDGVKLRLMKVPEYLDWAEKNKEFI